MFSFVLRRLGSGVILIFIVTFLTFFLTHLDTSQVAREVLGPSATPSAVVVENHQLGLDRPVFVQYWSWLVAAVGGNLGTSYFTDQPIVAALAIRLPITLSILLLAIVLTAIASVLIGAGAALRGGALDRILQVITMIGYVFPSLLLGIVFVLVFALTLHLLPATGFVPFDQSPLGWLGSIILPSATLAVGATASVAAQVRGSMINELSKDYVRTLRSRGISNRNVIFRHVLRNASGPALTTLSLSFIGMFGGALIIEQIFALSGFGQYSYTSTIQSDLPAIVGVVAVTVVIVVIVNLVIEIVGGLLNPKARVR